MVLRLRNKHSSDMGLTHVITQIESYDGSGTPFEARMLVDTGAMDSLAPGNSLVKAGIKPVARQIYELANGEFVEYAYGWARMKFLDADVLTKIIFGPKDVEPILGVVALESAGIVVDPSAQTLRRLAAVPLKQMQLDPGARRFC